MFQNTGLNGKLSDLKPCVKAKPTLFIPTPRILLIIRNQNPFKRINNFIYLIKG